MIRHTAGKRHRARARNLAILGLLGPVLAYAAAGPPPVQVEDCVVASVNTRIVTLVDLKIVQRFRLGTPAGETTLPAIRDEFVKRALVVEMARGQALPTKEEIESGVKDIALALGPEGYRAALDSFGLAEEDLAPYVEDQILFRKVVAARFGRSLPITIREIEAYYNDVFVPSRKREGREPPPMIQVLDRIESMIQEEKRAGQIEAWIENLKAEADIRINRDCLE